MSGDLIIGCTTNYDWDKLKYWVNSINQSDFEGDKVMVAFTISYDTIKKLTDAGFQVILPGKDEPENKRFFHQSNLPVHVERFVHIYNYIKEKNYRYIVTTDVKDVIFQRNPMDYIDSILTDDKNLIFASESMNYKDEPWGNQNLMETFGPYIYEQFKNNEIYNVGVLGGRGDAMRDLILNIFVMAVNRPIPICDQSTFNFMISQHPYITTSVYAKSEDAWAAQLGTTADPSKIEQFKSFLKEPSPIEKDGNIATSTGIPFTIVHQYDRVPNWKQIIEKKYG